MNPYIKSYKAGAAVPKHRIIKHGAADGEVILGAAATDGIFGVSVEIDADAGERVDVAVSGPMLIEYGGAVTRGDLLTSDAVGRAVTAAPGAGANNRIIGVADVSGVLNDIVDVFIVPGSLQG